MSLGLTPVGRAGLPLAGGSPARVPGDAGGPRPRCHWADDVCEQPPQHFVVWAGQDDDDPPEAETFCSRHYVLTLARLLELHLPTCPGPVAGHVLRWGRLDPED